MGDDTLYSGTVAAAMEGFLFDIPAIAFSQAQKGWHELDAAARVARSIIEQTPRDAPGAPHFLLNVNIPNRPDADTQPRRITRLAPPPCKRVGDPPGEPARRDRRSRPAIRTKSSKDHQVGESAYHP